MAWEYFNLSFFKKGFWSWKDCFLTSSFYFFRLEAWKSEVTYPRSFRKVSADLSLEFVSLEKGALEIGTGV